MNKEILIAGFGGQGILFSGKFLAYEGLIDGKEVKVAKFVKESTMN